MCQVTGVGRKEGRTVSKQLLSLNSSSRQDILFERISYFLLLALGAALLTTNSWFPAVDDECSIINAAARPAHETLMIFLRCAGQFEHPPLYDLVLHGWLRLTGGEIHLLRFPSILFYVLGAWLLAKAARHMEGSRSELYVITLVVLSPFGFHFGRLAAWYSFCFLSVSWLTLAYLKYLEEPVVMNWAWVFLSSLALVYSNYFGWAILACLALHFALRLRRDHSLSWRPFVGVAVLLLVSYLPLLSAFLDVLHSGICTSRPTLATFFIGIYNLNCIFVSESVAPWFWFLGVPAGIAITVCLILTFLRSPAQARPFLIYFASLLILMTVLGIVGTKRTLMIAPWLILPIGVTLGTLRRGVTRRALLASLIVIAIIGWYGIFSRTLYAAPRWVEPWQSVAQDAATVVRQGGVVIGNNPSFFFYLTYALPPDDSARSSGFSGLLPASVRHRNVFDPQQWILAGHPQGPTTLLVKGLHYSAVSPATEDAQQSLDQHCILQDVQQMAHDPGAKWKQRYVPDAGQIEWRVEVRTYACP
jgi:hypothetical protein